MYKGISKFTNRHNRKGLLVRVGYFDKQPIFQRMFMGGHTGSNLKRAKKFRDKAEKKLLSMCKFYTRGGTLLPRGLCVRNKTGINGINVSKFKTRHGNYYKTIQVHTRRNVGNKWLAVNTCFGFKKYGSVRNALLYAIVHRIEYETYRYGVTVINMSKFDTHLRKVRTLV